MVSGRKLSSFTLGLALFAMFFGSGNLIFPLFLGQLAQEQWIPAAIGFGLTAVIVPLIGVLSMVVFKGDYASFFSCFGKRGGLLAIFILLTVWIPLGSGARCAMLAYNSLLPYFESPPPIPLWGFSFLYCAFIYIIVKQKSRILDILGRYLTPILILCIAIIVVWGLNVDSISPHWSQEGGLLFVRGLKEGYNTMDLIASFFFSASIIKILQSCVNESTSLKKTLKASLVCSGFLGLIYLGLICLAAGHAEALRNVPKELQLVVLAKGVLGAQLGFIASSAIFLACMTTSIALTYVYAEFLADKVFKSREKYTLSLIITQVVTFGMSVTGLEGISLVTEPILMVFYPLLMILIVYNVTRSLIKKRKEAVVDAPMATEM